MAAVERIKSKTNREGCKEFKNAQLISEIKPGRRLVFLAEDDEGRLMRITTSTVKHVYGIFCKTHKVVETVNSQYLISLEE